MAIFSVRGVSEELQRAVRVRAAETGETIGEIVERALRKELGMMEVMTFQVIETNGGHLVLAVMEGTHIVYYAEGYEHMAEGLRECVHALQKGTHPIRDAWDTQDHIADPGEAYDRLVTSDPSTWRVVADESGVYYDQMGAAAREVFMVHWQDLELYDLDNRQVTDPDEIRAALTEYEERGSIYGYYFGQLGWPHEDDASTWGPPSPEAVDWSGF